MTACPHCGKELAPIVATVGGRAVQVGSHSCDCDAARAECAARMRADEAARAVERAARMERAGIPRRYRDATDPRAADAARAALQDGRGAWISGPVGCGKTHLACAVAIAAADAGASVRFATAAGLLDAVKAAYSRRDGSDDSALAPYENCGLLVLDDVGKEVPTAWALGRLFRVIDARYTSMRPVVCTSQYRRGALANRFAAADAETARALASRLCEMCGAVELDGPDRRMG